MITFHKPDWIEETRDVRLHAEVMVDSENAEHGIKPCPFCGHPYLTIANTHTPVFVVQCDKCTAEIHGKYHGSKMPFLSRTQALRAYRRAFKSAVIKWNQRPEKSIALNVNENVMVKLTDRGRQALLRERHYIPKEDADGWTIWQLHSLMTALGKHIGPGFGDSPFETTILVKRA